jgi:hypothetical protein
LASNEVSLILQVSELKPRVDLDPPSETCHGYGPLSSEVHKWTANEQQTQHDPLSTVVQKICINTGMYMFSSTDHYNGSALFGKFSYGDPQISWFDVFMSSYKFMSPDKKRMGLLTQELSCFDIFPFWYSNTLWLTNLCDHNNQHKK